MPIHHPSTTRQRHRHSAHFRTLRQATFSGMGSGPQAPFVLEPETSPALVKRQCAHIRATARHSLTLYAAARDGWFAVTDENGSVVWRNRIEGAAGSVNREAATAFAARKAVDAAGAIARTCNANGLLLYLRVDSVPMVTALQGFGTSTDRGVGGMYREPCEHGAALGVLVRPETSFGGNRARLVLPYHRPFGPRDDVPLQPLLRTETRALLRVSSDTNSGTASPTIPESAAASQVVPDREPRPYVSPLSTGPFDASRTRAVIEDLIVHANPWTAVEIGPELAQAILNYANYPGQRPIDDKRLRSHMEALSHRHWDRSVSDIHFYIFKHGVAIYLLNGQHRMLACVRTGRPLRTRVIAGFAESESDLAHKYFLFDQPIAARSTSEVIDSTYAESTLGYPKSLIEQFALGLDVLHTDLLRDGSRDRNALIDEIGHWRPQLDALRLATQKGSEAVRSRLYASKPLAVLLYLLRYQPVKAAEFVHGVTHFNELKGSDPRTRLGAQLEHSRLSRRDTGTLVARGWNATCGANDDLSRTSRTWPPAISDTPLASKQ